jgi:preprotein translocase subunit SecA
MTAVCPKDEAVDREMLVEAIAAEVTDALESESVKIKPYYKNLGLRLLPSWIKAALQALHEMKAKQQYIVEGRKIVIIDPNTGVRMDRTRWQNGLHEFLELKHGLPVGQDSFTAVYYSNLRFYRDYGPGICGLSGTVHL